MTSTDQSDLFMSAEKSSSSNEQPLSGEAGFAKAWWGHNRGNRTFPNANEFGIPDSLAAAIARQCEICQRFEGAK